MIRFIHLFNYSEGVSKKDGEAWYLNNHVTEVKNIPGVLKYRSWPCAHVGIPYPSPGAPTPFDQFVRRSELCFENVEIAVQALKDNAQLWTPAAKGVPGFREFECMLLEEEPEYNLLRDAPHQHYKYMTLPLWWPKGRPEIDEEAEIFVDSYCIGYASHVTISQGEDWYLGHHTREGKQLPGMRHYKTWRTLRVKEELPEPLNLNKWYRLTELGMSLEAFKVTMCDNETRIRFTQSPFGNVISHWINIDLKLDTADNFI